MLTAQTQNVIFIDALRVDHPSKLNVPKNTDMNMAEIACFLALLMRLISHNTYSQENKLLNKTEQY